MEGRELDCCEVNGGRLGVSVDSSLFVFHGIVEGFPDAIGDCSPGLDDRLSFPSVTVTI